MIKNTSLASPVPVRPKFGRLVCVEGNIASGKTSVLQYLSQWLDTVEEPMEQWKDLGGNNAFQMMYEDPKRWGMMFQSYVQLTMLKAHLACTSSQQDRVMERSIFSARYCFVENLHRRGLMHDVDFALLDEWFQWIITNCNVKPELFVYLKTSPEISFERVKKRSRKEESVVQLDYLVDLDKLHNEWLSVGKDLSIPIEVIDANQPIDQVLEKVRLALYRHNFDLTATTPAADAKSSLITSVV